MMLQDKVAIVTGVGPGMGRAIALAFAREGACLAVGARSEERVHAIAKEAEAFGQPVIGIRTDLSDRDSCRQIVQATIERFGGVDILVQNGFDESEFRPVAEGNIERWRHTMEVNLIGTLHLVQAVVPSMKERGDGRIVLINSGAAIDPLPNFGAYGASKAALASLVRSLATELGQFGIRANGVHLGPVDEAHNRRWREIQARRAGITDEEFYKRFTSIFPLRYVPPPEECAGTVLFLASDLSRPITGQGIFVNAGRFAA